MVRNLVRFVLVALLIGGSARVLCADAGDDQYAVAAGHYAAKRWELAVGEFRTLLKEHPEHPTSSKAIFFLGEALVELGRYNEAHAEFERFLVRDPQSGYARQALFRSGETAMLAGQTDSARKALTDFHGKYAADPLGAYALLYLGQMSLTAHDGAAAKKAFDEGLASYPTSPAGDEIRLGLARALELTGDSHEAEQRYHELAAGHDTSSAEQAQLQLATRALESEKYADAIAAFDAFEKEHPDSRLLPQVRAGRGRALYQVADAQYRAGKFDQAIATLEPYAKATANKADAEDPQVVANRYLLVLSYQGAQRHADALALLDDMSHTASDELATKIQLARAASLIATEKFAAAAETLEAYLKTQPSGQYAVRAMGQLAVCDARLKRLDSAHEYSARFTRQILLLGGGPALTELELSTTQQLADAVLAAGDAKWASELFARLAADGNPPEFVVQGLSGLGWSQWKSGEAEQASATFDKLLDKFPDGAGAAEAAFARGQILEGLKKYDAALASYQIVVDHHATSKSYPDALLAAARLHAQLHQEGQAVELYQRFIKEHADSPQLDAARYGCGWAQRDSGHTAEANQEFQKLHDDFRESRFWPDATFRLAESAAAAKQADRARQLLDELLTVKRSTDLAPHALYLEGQLAAADGKWEQVEKLMGQLVHDFPKADLRLPAEYWIAEAAYRQGRYDDAGAKFERLAGRTAGRKDAWLAMIPLRRAQVLAQAKQWPEAQQMAQQIEKDYPGFSEQYEADYLLGRAAASQADFETARKMYQKVVRSPTGGKSETAAMAQWMIGETYFHQDNYEVALREYLRVEILYPYPRWQAAALLQAGKCQELLGRGKDAAELYARLIKVYPNTEFTEEAQRRLRTEEGAAATASRSGRSQ